MKGHAMIPTLGGLAMMAMLSGAKLPKIDRRCRYTSFCGPIYPTTRQQRRAMQRKADAALARLA